MRDGGKYHGDVYKGNFKNGMYDGIGVYVWNDGRIYEGEWKQQKPHGKG